MNVSERLRKYIRSLRITNSEFERSIGASNGYINSIRKSIGVDKIEQLESKYPTLNLDWLLKGEGEMLKDIEFDLNPYLVTKSGSRFYEMPNGTYMMSVPFVPIKAYAKYVDEQIDTYTDEATEYYSFIVPQIGHGHYMAFEIKGDSMDDNTRASLADGDIVLGRELSRDLWRNKLHINEFPNWIIVMDNTILCKQIIDHDVDKGTITCHSLNPSPEYADFTLSFNHIRKMFNIIQRVSQMR